jgi:peptidoglycan/LPS O-acetylase OafA/YrhL
MTGEHKRIDTLDALRGLASFGVCYYHLTNGNPAFLPEGMLKASGYYGWLGVEVFFVISGFVIPYALRRAGYELRNYGTFVLKRVVRLDPPYLMTIGLILVYYFLSFKAPALWDPRIKITPVQILLHLGYVNVFFGYDWVNPVFWTLAIEFQYYLLVGLLYPLIGSRNATVRIITLLALSPLPFLITSPAFIFRHLYLFMIGMLTFQYHSGLLSKRSYLLTFPLMFAGMYYTLGQLIAAAGVATAASIAFIKIKGGVLRFFGDISYSLYLLHLPVGATLIIIFVKSATSMTSKVFLLIAATGLSIAASYVLYRLVERPSQKLSSAISYRPRREAAGKSKAAVAEVSTV